MDKKEKIDEKFEQYLEKKRKEFREIEEAVLNLCEERKFDPLTVAPTLLLLFADISKGMLDRNYEECIGFAIKTISEVYDVEVVQVQNKEIDETHIHKGTNTPH